MMNKIRIACSLIVVSLIMMPKVVYSQREKVKNDSWYDEKLLHVGFCVGFNTMDFKIVPSQRNYVADSLFPEITSLKPGINIQIVTDYHPAPSIDLRFLPGVSFGQRNVVYYRNSDVYNDRQNLESSFLEFPLLLKYKGVRLNNVRPYVIGGINYRFDLAGKKEYDEDKPVYLRLRKSDIYYETGAGLDMYLTYFKLTVELRVSNGIRDILVHDPAPGHPQFVNAIERMKSQIWVLAFYFE